MAAGARMVTAGARRLLRKKALMPCAPPPVQPCAPTCPPTRARPDALHPLCSGLVQSSPHAISLHAARPAPPPCIQAGARLHARGVRCMRPRCLWRCGCDEAHSGGCAAVSRLKDGLPLLFNLFASCHTGIRKLGPLTCHSDAGSSRM
eukprot:365329-Chlamydomonas_euryale.AAC.1